MFTYNCIRSCGDVTHFAKDCPEKQKHKKEEDMPTIGIINNRVIEDLYDEQTSRKRKQQNNIQIFKKKKIVIMK